MTALECNICLEPLLSPDNEEEVNEEDEDLFDSDDEYFENPANLVPNSQNKKDSVITPCGHMYHRSCIDLWLIHNQRDRSCPTCREKISTRRFIPLDLESQYLQITSAQEDEEGQGEAKCHNVALHKQLTKDFKRLQQLFSEGKEKLERLQAENQSLQLTINGTPAEERKSPLQAARRLTPTNNQKLQKCSTVANQSQNHNDLMTNSVLQLQLFDLASAQRNDEEDDNISVSHDSDYSEVESQISFQDDDEADQELLADENETISEDLPTPTLDDDSEFEDNSDDDL